MVIYFVYNNTYIIHLSWQRGLQNQWYANSNKHISCLEKLFIMFIKDNAKEYIQGRGPLVKFLVDLSIILDPIREK